MSIRYTEPKTGKEMVFSMSGIKVRAGELKAEFNMMSKDCPCNTVSGCVHAGYHKDFSLANVCCFQYCPELF